MQRRTWVTALAGIIGLGVISFFSFNLAYGGPVKVGAFVGLLVCLGYILWFCLKVAPTYPQKWWQRNFHPLQELAVVIIIGVFWLISDSLKTPLTDVSFNLWHVADFISWMLVVTTGILGMTQVDYRRRLKRGREDQ
ncbi:hypothetical protein LZY01_15550 [Levilactobacillus zymae]|uniref:Uncharacterized protein n=1 Tax=Levilactobacillus zymae TaxID=267363 RepID=A0ABQ0X201_9LACO|nr:hypothetical protein [Levilactobacillus zymae]KRL12671.1 hypothetical protein FD38_GL001406 [Levilactobacillus zymae DSM 19395]QFR61979.1 hypothetical protein LZ395_10745 [Levilactobacillus zymae]GEO72387.1 hypothetical protein LZY01_15550 [Levilactobacillus zymae]